MTRATLVVFAAIALAACTVDTRVATFGDGGADAGPTPAFLTLPAGAALPDEATCAARVLRASFEPRPANATANHRVATGAELAQLTPWNDELAFDARALALQARVTGDFVGTTDEILQWVACKWGFDVDHVRAEAAASTGWTQGFRADWSPTPDDCPTGADTRSDADGGVKCATTYGILQITWRYHKTAWPVFRDSTPFHLDYAFGLRRVCMEGWDLSQSARAPAGIPYAANDEWGCMGAYFSGQWHDASAEGYIARVKGQLAGRSWTRPDF